MTRAKTVAAIAAGALAASALTGVAIAASATADDDSTTSQHGAGERARDHAGRPGLEGPAVASRGEHGPGGHGPGGRGPGGHGPGGHGPGLGPDGGLLHGEAVVESADGDYETKQIQRGEVTAVSATSITVVSEDGFSATYVVNADTESTRDREEGSARIGDLVHVLADVDGTTVTAERIDAMSPEAVAEMQEHRAEMEEHRAEMNRRDR